MINIFQRYAAWVAAALLCVSSFCLASAQQINPKREFRGAWLHVIGQTQWQNKTTDQAKAYIREQFQKLQDAGCNAVIFQVRPMADAVYKSDLEPWSAWLTGKRGKAPDPMWDPMEYAIEEAHKRGMEFHAWLNPYRVTSSAKEELPRSHSFYKEPYRFVRYNGQILYNPAYQENRDEICRVVKDICTRYDVDAIHIDDYFYPYPAKGQKFPDEESYRKSGSDAPLADWRRHNVDLLIEQLHSTIKGTKPWVRFGVSPFGIWRNKRTDPRGSESTGLQNYDDLYADVLLWAKNGWVDYLAPQLYWSLDTKAAPSRSLAQWWNDNVDPDVDIYIGQDVKRTMDSPDPGNHDSNELDTKMRLGRRLPNVKGNIWWHGYWVTGNYKGVADSLAMKYQSTLALPPVYGDKGVKPVKPSNVRVVKEHGKTFVKWDAPAKYAEEKSEDVVKFVVYEFFKGEKMDLSDAQTIIAVTPSAAVLVNDEDLKDATFAVTSVDRLNRESEPVFVKR